MSSSGSQLSNELKSIETAFQTAFNPKNSTSFLSRCISCASQIRIPQNYQDVLAWLASIGAQAALSEATGSAVDKTAITTALIISAEYAAKDTVTNPLAANALKLTINTLAAKYALNLKDVVNPADLVQYCEQHDIEIPTEIQPMLTPSHAAVI